MAVYTHISAEAFEALLLEYDLGTLKSFKGIAEGVSNTNYLLNTSEDRFIATVYEKQTDTSHLPFYWGLMEHLAGDGVVCPVPVRDKKGEILKTVEGCAFALVSFLEGKWPRVLSNEHCNEVGRAMARMHESALSFDGELVNPMSVDAWQARFVEIEPQVKAVYGAKLSDEIGQSLKHIADNWPTAGELPYGVIHGDLFPDNVFFEGNKLTGLIDFYLSCNDFFAYDVAITLNAWCFERRAEFNITKAKQLLKGYNAAKPFTDAELSALPILCAGAAMRFLLSRLYDELHQVEGAEVTVKDPREYLQKLRFHMQVRSHREYGL